MREMDETAEDARDPEAIVNAFLQHKSMNHMQEYLARGRRFAELDMERLNKDWIIAVRGWLAHKHRTPPLQAEPRLAVQTAAAPTVSIKLSDEEIAAIVAGGRQLMVAGDIPNARLVLQQAAESDNATAALELGATYDPTILQQQKTRMQMQVRLPPRASTAPVAAESVPGMADTADVRMARLWYEKARDLGSTEATARLERLRSAPNPRR
jgi:hypothetical protein